MALASGQPLCGCNFDMLRKPIAEELYNKFLAACRDQASQQSFSLL
jgi:hypothetical protein